MEVTIRLIIKSSLKAHGVYAIKGRRRAHLQTRARSAGPGNSNDTGTPGECAHWHVGSGRVGVGVSTLTR